MLQHGSKIKLPAALVKVYGSHMELVAAINRLLREGWEEADEEVVEIPRDTVERLRDDRGAVQWAKLRGLLGVRAIEYALSRQNGKPRQPGTLMLAERVTNCPYCNQTIRPGMLMVNTYVEGATRAIDVDCANREDVPYRATSRLVKQVEAMERSYQRSRKFAQETLTPGVT